MDIGKIRGLKEILFSLFSKTYNSQLPLFSSGKTDLSYVDPVVIGRGLFGVINNFTCGVVGYIQDVLCAVCDTILDVGKGI